MKATTGITLACLLLCSAGLAQEDEINPGMLGGDVGQMLQGASAQSIADMLLPNLGTAMGLPPRHSVSIDEADRSQLRSVLLDIMKRQYPGDTLDHMNAAYQQIGLVPARTNLREEALKLYEGQVAGFYDPHSGKLALVRGSPAAQQVQVLQHELAHALQDQYFTLQTMLDQVMRDEDQALALQAVIEGQAVVAMFGGGGASAGGPQTKEEARQALHDAGMDVSDAELDSMISPGQNGPKFSLSQLMIPDKPPAGDVPYLQAQLLFPYQEGTRFIEHFMEQSSFAATISKTLGHPPRSTRQILHPQAYANNAAPVPVDTSHSETAGKVAYGTTVGELNIRTLFGGPGQGDAAADGWVGDHLSAMQVNGGMTVVWISAWQSVADANEFARAMHGVFAARADMSHDDTFSRGGQNDVIVRAGKRVGVLAGVPQGQRVAWLERLQQDLQGF